MAEFVKYGNVEIQLPDENLACFSIFQDLTDLFGVDFQSEAIALLKSELKSHTGLKTKPCIDYESDYADITSRSANVIFLVAGIINNLVQKEEKIEVSDTDRQEVFKRLKEWKRPRPAKWKIGDVFSVKLKDSTFMFGQIIGTHLTPKSPTCAIFEIKRPTEDVLFDELKGSRAISIQNTDGEYLNKKIFKVLFNTELLADVKQIIENRSTGDANLLRLCNAYYGLEPWNILYEDTYYDNMLLKGVERPLRVILLDKDARKKWQITNSKPTEQNGTPPDIIYIKY